MGESELGDRVRREESEAARAAGSHVVRVTCAGTVIVVVALFGSEALSQILPVLDRSISNSLLTIPIVIAGLVVVTSLVDATGNGRRWFKAHTIRRKVDRNPELAAVLVPPLAAHLQTLKKIAGHSGATVRKLAWTTLAGVLFVGSLVGLVTFPAQDGSSRNDPHAALWALGLFGTITLVFLVPAVIRGRRWYTGWTVQRLSRDPTLAARLYQLGADPSRSSVTAIPPLVVTFVQPPCAHGALQPVTARSNVLGTRPIRIAYLRLFENRARVRDFLQGAWREVGYVHLLRSAASVSPVELRRARKAGTAASLFVNSPRLFRLELDRQPLEPVQPGRHRLDAITDIPVKVRDPYGSYPVRSVLCHASFWQTAVDLLLARVDLVVLDMSGYRPSNAGTRFELQRVIDRFPIARVALLCDPDSDRVFLEAQIRHHWAQMASGSPNTGPTPREIVVASTTSHPLGTRWLADRATSRWLVAHLQSRGDA